MKYISYLIVMFSILLLVGCTTETTKKEAELKAAIKAELDAEHKTIDEAQNEIKEESDIKDINRVIDFVNETDTNRMTDQNGKQLKILENYDIHYFDFTGEGNDDVVIVTWEDDNRYLPVIFVTTDILENEYYLINSDFYADEGDEFFSEGNFIIKEDKKNESYDIAYNIENEFIQMATRYIDYGHVTQILQPEIDIKYIIDYTLEKVDRFNRFNVYSTFTYYDELGEKHKYDDITRKYIFNKENHGYNIVETHNMDSISLEKLVAENFVVGTDDSLKTFETIYNESDLETAIKYYYNNRQQFDKDTRIKYIKDYQNFMAGILNILNYGIYPRDEVITDGVISTVTFNMAPIPEKVNSVFSIVKVFNVMDGANLTDSILDNGWYTITCIQKDMTEKIELMYYDKEVLISDEHVYQRMVDGYVNTELVTQEQMLDDIEHITYPTVLIQNLSQLDEFEHKDIWKTNVAIVPENIILIKNKK